MSHVEIQGAYTKGIIDGKGRNKVPPHFSTYLRNVRIENGSMTSRKGPQQVYNLGNTPVRQLHWNNGELLCMAGGFLYRLSPGPVQVYGQIADPSAKITMMSQGNYTIILNGRDAPRVYSRVDGLFNSAVPGGPNSGPNTIPYAGPTQDPVLQVPYPVIGATMTGFSFFSGSLPENDHVLYISKPVTPDAPRHAYDRGRQATQVGNQLGAQSDYDVGENRHMTSTILGMVANIDNLYIFCEKTIETLNRQTVTSAGDTTSLYTLPIGDGDQLAGIHMACSAGQKIFFFTKSLHVKTIGYQPGIAYPMIGDLSHRQGQEIRYFMECELDDDQSCGVAFFDKKENTIEFQLKSKGSSVNDITLIYDITADTFLVDNNKSFSCMTWGGHDGDRAYCGDFSTGQVYIDDNWRDDQVTGGAIVPIPVEHNTPNIALGHASFMKQFRGFSILGAMNPNTTLEIECYIDGRLEFTKEISRADIYPTENQAVTVGGDETNLPNIKEFRPFEYVADQGMLRKKGKRIRIKVKGERLGQERYLDGLSIDAEATGIFELNDKF